MIRWTSCLKPVPFLLKDVKDVFFYLECPSLTTLFRTFDQAVWNRKKLVMSHVNFVHVRWNRVTLQRIPPIGIENRFCALWKSGDESVANFRLNKTKCNEESQRLHGIQEPCCAFLFHVAAIIDVGECRLDFLDVIEESRIDYFRIVSGAVIWEVIELD